MKKSELRQIIKEELSNVLSEELNLDQSKVNDIIRILKRYNLDVRNDDEFKKNMMIILRKTDAKSVEPGTDIGSIDRDEIKNFNKLTKDIPWKS